MNWEKGYFFNRQDHVWEIGKMLLYKESIVKNEWHLYTSMKKWKLERKYLVTIAILCNMFNIVIVWYCTTQRYLLSNVNNCTETSLQDVFSLIISYWFDLKATLPFWDFNANMSKKLQLFFIYLHICLVHQTKQNLK